MPDPSSTVTLPSNAVWCSGEGGVCTFNGTATVYYGAGSRYYKQDNITGGIACNNDVFKDPISGTTKNCYYVLTGSPSGCQTVSGEVRLYDLTNCEGDQISAGSTGLFQYESAFNDRAESIAVPSGWSARLYVDNSESSASACITSTDSDLWNNTFVGGGVVANQTTWMRVYSNNSCAGDTQPNGSWNARYFSGSSGWWDPASLSNATPSCTETLSSGLDKNYGSSAPCNNDMNGDDWVGEYTSTINFPAGNYVFILDHDDGMKLWLNGSNITERGGSGGPNDYVCPARYLSGNANLKAMLREEGGDARIKLTWSTDTSLCVSRPSAPSLQSPGDGTTYNENQPTTLSWSATGDDYYGEITGGPSPLSFGWQTGTRKDIGALWAGYTYTWRVKARNSAGEGDWSSTRTFTVLPAAPGGLSASAAACNQVNLSWSDNSGNEEGYKVYRGGSLIATLDAGATSYQDTSVSANTAYSYTVYAYRGSFLSPVSNTASVTTPSCGAGVPGLISPSSGAIFDEGQSITLTWSATGAEYYGEITGGPAGVSTFGWQTGASKTIGSQWAGYSYSWRVKARNSVSTSAYSSPNTFTVRPAQPTGLAASAPFCGRVNLTWADNAGSEAGYEIYRGGSRLATLASNVTSYQDNSVSGETSYTYTVYAYRGSIYSPVSNTASVTTAVCPPSNDHMANASVVSPGALPYTNTQTTRGATTEAAEPVYQVGSSLGASVWYRFTPSVTGDYAFDTYGSDYNTVLHLFKQVDPGTLQLIQGDDNDSALGVTQSKIVFTGQANTTYLFSITQAGGSTGGALTAHLAAVPCPAGSLCVTVTSPYYTAYTYDVDIYDSAGKYVKYVRLDSYGYGAFSGLAAGPYRAVANGWNMVAAVDNAPASGYLDITGVGLPSILIALKDLNGANIAASAYLETGSASFYVGQSTDSAPLTVYASPDNYLLLQRGVTAKYLALKDITVQPGMQKADMAYNVAEMPAASFQYHLQTIPSVNLTLWRGSRGTSIELSDGQTGVISFPAGKIYTVDHIVGTQDASEYWYYEFQSSDLQMQTFRASKQISLGGSLKIAVSASQAPYGRGDTTRINYSVLDQFDNRLMYMWSQAKTASQRPAGALAQNSAPTTQALLAEDNHLTFRRAESAGLEPQALGSVNSTVQLLNPSGGQAYQVTQADWFGSLNWALPTDAPIGDWTARVTANHLGLWQGQTTGSQIFAVKNSAPPSNDDFATPQAVNNLPYATNEDTFGATQADDDPAMPACNLRPAAATVWFRYQPAQAGTLRLDTIGSDYDTVLAVFTGSRGSLNLVGCNDDRIIEPRDQDSELSVPVSPEANYYIMIGKYNGDLTYSAARAGAKPGLILQTAGAGVAQLHLSFTASLPGQAHLVSPNNDTFLVRTPLFTWTPATAATQYYLAVENSRGETVLSVTVDAQTACQATICSYKPGMQFTNAGYTWQVLALNSLGSGPWSETFAFSVNAPEIQLFLPTLLRQP